MVLAAGAQLRLPPAGHLYCDQHTCWLIDNPTTAGRTSYLEGGNRMDTLTPGGQLQLNQTLQSNNGEHTLVMQPDGNLVLYEGWPSSPSPIWASNTEWLPTG